MPIRRTPSGPNVPYGFNTTAADIHRSIQWHIESMKRRTERALRASAHVLLKQSQAIVPIETYALHDSGHVRQEGAGFYTVMVVGYAGEDYGPILGVDKKGKYVYRKPAEYAFYVHEKIELRHEDGKQALFLERPILEQQGEQLQARYREFLTF